MKFNKKKALKKFINENGFFYTGEVKLFTNAPEEQKKNIPEGATYFEAIVSDGELNRNGYIIRPKALMESWDTYKTNPVILKSHDPKEPIGNALSASLLSADGKGGVRMSGYIFDDLTDGRFSRGLFNGFSTGTIIEAVEFENVKTGEVLSVEEFRKMREEKGYYGEWENDWVMVATKVDWVESSLVSLPSNKKALVSKKNAIDLFFKNELNEEKAREITKNEEGEGEDESDEPAEQKADEQPEKTDQPNADEGKGTETAGENPEASAAAENAEGAEEEPKPEEAPKAEEKIRISKEDRAKLKAASDLLVQTLEATTDEGEEEPKAEDQPEAEKPATGEQPEKQPEGEQPSPEANQPADNAIAEDKAKEVAPEIKAALQELVNLNSTLEKENASLKDQLSKIPNKKGLSMTSQFTEPKKEDKAPAGEAVMNLLRGAGFSV